MLLGGHDRARHENGLGDNVRVLLVGDTGKGIVPSDNGADNAKVARGLDARVVDGHVTGSEHQKGAKEQKEKGEKGDRGLQGERRHDEGENEPSQKEKGNDIVEFLLSLVSSHNAKGLSVDGGPGQPKGAKARKGGSTKRVFKGNLPHAGKQLNKATVKVRQPNHAASAVDTTGIHIHQRKHKQRQCKRTKTQRGRVAKLAGGRGVGTGLKVAAKGRHELLLEDLGVANVQNLVLVARRDNALNGGAIVGGGARVLVGGLLLHVQVRLNSRHCCVLISWVGVCVLVERVLRVCVAWLYFDEKVGRKMKKGKKKKKGRPFVGFI